MITIMVDKLKPCPFCDGQAVWCGEHEEKHTCHFIVCVGDCGGSFDMSNGYNPEQLEALLSYCSMQWNKRSLDDHSNVNKD